MNEYDILRPLCVGCHNDFYNREGNSERGMCWMLPSAKPVERTKVGVWQNPPYEWKPQRTLSCHTPDGERWITKDDPRIAKQPTRAEGEV